MLDNLPLIAIVLIILWLAAFAFYMYTSRQQRDIENELDALKKMLGPEETDESERPGR
ncbi:MAG TPA: hypothetical protein VF177_13925 [Anaerolineae bacterium]